MSAVAGGPTMTASFPRCYSQRLLNPYRGIANVVEVEQADAVTQDGVHWSLYVHGEIDHAVMDDGSVRAIALPDVKFATWSRRTGLKRAPVRDVTDYDRVDALGSRLLAALKTRAEAVPFPLSDCYELWLLSADTGRPLALLDSACGPEGLELPERPEWRPGQAAREQFRPPRAPEEALCPAEALARRVNAAAGPAPSCRWFRRLPDGSGEPADGRRPESERKGIPVSAGFFPVLNLDETWSDAGTSALVRSYLDWQAPCLLQLQNLSRPMRERLERAARERPEETSRQWRLFPQVLDNEGLTVVLVEAKLRGSTATDRPAAEMPLSPDPIYPFFNE